MVTVSAVLHVAGFAAAVLLPRLIPRGPGGPPVYVVDLVALPAGPTTTLPPSGGGATKSQPSPPAPAKPEKAIPIPARGHKPEPKLTDKKPKSTPTPAKGQPTPKDKPNDKEKAVPAPAAATPPATAPVATEPSGAAGAGSGGTSTGTGAGGMGGTGSGQADAATFYGNLLRQRIEGAWIRPLYPPNWPGLQPPTATVRINLTSSGRVTSVALAAPSDYEAMDQSIMRAVQDAQPFPPFPSQLGRDVLSVSIDFVLPPK